MKLKDLESMIAILRKRNISDETEVVMRTGDKTWESVRYVGQSHLMGTELSADSKHPVCIWYDLCDGEPVARYLDCTVYITPCCKMKVDDREWVSLPAFSRDIKRYVDIDGCIHQGF